jgi:hypothetical protein
VTALVRASEVSDEIAAHNAEMFTDMERSHYRALAVLCVPAVAFVSALVALVVVVLR